MSDLVTFLPEWEQVCHDEYWHKLIDYNGTLQCNDYNITQNITDSIDHCYKCHVKF